jgi:hypothetical protein
MQTAIFLSKFSPLGEVAVRAAPGRVVAPGVAGAARSTVGRSVAVCASAGAAIIPPIALRQNAVIHFFAAIVISISSSYNLSAHAPEPVASTRIYAARVTRRKTIEKSAAATTMPDKRPRTASAATAPFRKHASEIAEKKRWQSDARDSPPDDVTSTR